MLFPLVFSFFLACIFQFCSRSTLPSAPFVYRLPCYPRLSTESLILLIWFCMYSVCSFRYTLVNLFCAFLSFLVLILVGFLLLRREAVFTSALFFLTANVSYGTLGLVLYLVGMHYAAAAAAAAAVSKGALTKYSYSSFEVGVSDISWSASHLFLSINVNLSLIFLLLSRDQS